MPQLRTHKGLSDIEADIKRYYEDGTIDVLTLALTIAGRAMAIAVTAHHPSRWIRGRVENLKINLFDILLDLQR